MARRPRRRHRTRRRRPRPRTDRAPGPAGPPRRHQPALQRQHRLHQHHPRRTAAAPARRPGHGGADPRLHALERHGHGAARQPRHQRRRPHRQLRLGGDALRHRLQPLLARALGEARRRPRLCPGPFGAWHLCPCLPARAAHRRADGQLPPGGRRQGPVLLSAPLADARLLAIPDGLARDRRDHLDLPGALHEVSASARARPTRSSRSAPSASPAANGSTT